MCANFGSKSLSVMLVLDTDVMVDLQRGFPPALGWLGQLPGAPAITVITVLELLQGCRNQREQAAIEQLIQRMPVLYLDEPACIRAVDYFRAFHLSHGSGGVGRADCCDCEYSGANFVQFQREALSRPIPDLQVVTPYARE
ncbi:MAG: hypothetical protein KatS3mg019_0042 [Fimbriimonadales bacterium]|nr:MAG: hypothetical protein KatS3mg019_0042 [Fimbriimonadales bacterium]